MSASCHTLVMLLLLTGCARQEIRPAATGPDGEVLVVIAPAHWEGAAGEAIRTALSSPIATLPTPEPLFDLRTVAFSETDRPRIEAHPQVVLVGALQDSTAEATFLRARLAPAAEAALQQGTGAVVPRPAYWRTQQQVYFVMAASPDALVSVLRQHGEVLREGFARLSRERLSRAMYDRGRQRTLEQHLLAQHGFALHVQHDYALAADTAGFVWLRRVLPETWRSLFVYYEEAADATRLTPDWVRATRERLGKRYLQSNAGGYVAGGYVAGGYVTPDPRRPDTLYPVSFLQYQGYEWRGLWQLVGADTTGRVVPLGMGGPFLAYAFYEATQRRLYLIEGMVFAPGFPKREFLRQMEAMASTFVTSAKPSP